MQPKRANSRSAVFLAVILALVAGAVTMSVPTGPAAPATAAVREAPTASVAFAIARRQGTPVEVVDQRTSTRTVFANPGGTLTAEIGAVPQRVRRGGTWLPVDTTLTILPDGRVAPRAAEGDLVLSGGGADAPLATMTWDGRAIALYWPAALPKPVLARDRATYAEVLPGVDLVMIAGRDGFAQHLVIEDATAAKNPALQAIRLRVAAQGIALRADTDGALHAVDAAGVEVFTAPPSLMWDAGGPTNRSGRVGVSVVDDVLVLTPDKGFLADPATRYPVTVDPPMRTFGRQAWATVLSGKADTSFWNTSGEAPWAQVGQCYTPDGRCNDIFLARAYFQFDTSFIGDRVVKSGTFATTVVHSPSCATRVHKLHRTTEISSGMTWNSRLEGPAIGAFDAPGVWGSSCGGWKSVGVGIGDNFNRHGVSTYFLRADSDSDIWAWRKYNPEETVLRVEYNTLPSAPDLLSTQPPTDAATNVACFWCGGRRYLGDARMWLVARLSDPDGHAVDPAWEVYRNGVLYRDIGWRGLFQQSGATHDAFLDLGDDLDGATVTWRVRGGDGIDGGPFTNAPDAFVVDRRAPKVAPKVTGVLYPKDDNRWHGGVGVPDTFTFEPKDGTAAPADDIGDVDHYEYGWTDDPRTPAKAQSLGGRAVVTIAPEGDGPRTLFVRSVDRAGHRSPVTAYRIYVRAGNGAVAHWSYEGSAEDTAFLGDRDGRLEGGASFTGAAVGTGLLLDGAAGTRMTAPNTVRTDASFSVATWVWLDRDDGGRYSVLTQDSDTAHPGFTLGYESNRWLFSIPNDRVNPTASFILRPANEPVARTWTHLAATYDATTRLITMYVDGVRIAALPRTTSWHANGPVRVGTGWTGIIDETQLYDRALTDTEVSAMVSKDNIQTGHWRFDEGDGETAGNSVEGGADGVLRGGATFTGNGPSAADTGAVNGAVEFDGVDDHVTMSQPAVRTDQSFSVSAYVWAADLPGAGTSMTAVSQEGAHHSGFYLQYSGDRKQWVFAGLSADDDTTPDRYEVLGATPPTTRTWVNLTGTYEAATRKMSLYVDGRLANSQVLPAPAWNAQGPLVVGRGRFLDRETGFWNGMVDEVRTYSRALSAGEIEGIISRSDVPAASWRLDGDATDEAADTRSTDIVGNPGWTAGQSVNPDPNDLAVKLDGSDDHLRTTAVLDPRRDYSVAAWVQLAEKRTGTQTVISQSGVNVSAFRLGYTGAGTAATADRWLFEMTGPDSVMPTTTTQVRSTTLAQAGVWTHLAAVYRPATGEMTLYVNGVPEGSAQFAGSATWGPQTALDIGRGRTRGVFSQYFPGALDDVKVYSRPLFAAEVRTMSGRDLPLVHNWRFDEEGGAGAADSAGGRGATVSSTVRRTPGWVGNALTFQGPGDVATTSAVDVRTDQSFTVTAWVRHDPARPCPTQTVCQSDAVSLDGGTTSKFRLGHVIDGDQAPGPYGKWIFEMPNASGVPDEVALSVRESQVREWVFLVGMYDAPSGQLLLYVYTPGVAEPDTDTGHLQTAWSAAGGLRIGQGRKDGAPANFWSGSVDDVRLYTGALDDDRVTSLFRSYPPTRSAPTLPLASGGRWRFDENTGTTSADGSGRGHPVTLKNGAGWGAGGRERSALLLDGPAESAETAGPVLPAGAPFSVSAWAYLSTRDGADRTVLAQDGPAASSFVLRYQGRTGRWATSVTGVGATGEPATVEAVSTEPAQLGLWTHLAVTHDGSRLRLYVNGVVSQVRVAAPTPVSAGPFTIGRAKAGGTGTAYFAGSIDDVRVFDAGALTDGEVRRLHDDVPPIVHGFWGFEGNGNDTSWRRNPATLSGTTSFGPGTRGRALQLDGATGAAATAAVGVNMGDSFTVSAWAKLTTTAKDATVVAQDGTRMSGFVLQYNKAVDRWVFGAPAQDSDAAVQLVHAFSAQPPTTGRWTHLAGVYDYPARQLRLYVDGALVGTRDNAPLWTGWGAFTIGRSTEAGAAADHFTGSLDEVRTDVGAVPVGEIAERAGYPAPPADGLVRFVNRAGEHRSRTSPGAHTEPFQDVPAGYHAEGPMGRLLTNEQPGTRQLFSCATNTDEFTSTDPACGGAAPLGPLGWAYDGPQESVPTIALYRCTTGQERFDSLDPNCEGSRKEDDLGYVIAYATLNRYVYALENEHTSTVYGTPPGYRREEALGVLRMTVGPGTAQVFSCHTGLDEFTSLDPGCEGATRGPSLGHLWTAPPEGVPSVALYRCRMSNGERFLSLGQDCEGAPNTLDGRLGYVLTS